MTTLNWVMFSSSALEHSQSSASSGSFVSTEGTGSISIATSTNGFKDYQTC